MSLSTPPAAGRLATALAKQIFTVERQSEYSLLKKNQKLSIHLFKIQKIVEFYFSWLAAAVLTALVLVVVAAIVKMVNFAAFI